ncbi:MAG: carboxypeptidase-like regulatory domain-containing protein [Cyclobacteriaceae bacterium]|nr:carboxypeptidase-like regulatory domain-containing protein [Cyclobacteriaceae bacterium]
MLVEGIVIDSKTKEPLPFASVGIRNTFIGTATNSTGRFVFTVPATMSDSTLVCSFMGYKNHMMPLKKVKNPMTIAMVSDVITLKEVEVRPWQPWDYVRNAMQKLRVNYPENAYMSQGYYSEYIQENGVFLKFTEGVVETYNPRYGDTLDSQSRALEARRGDDLGQLQFMRDKLDKKLEKEKKKAIKNGEAPDEDDAESIDEAILSASFGGPKTMISIDPLRDTASYLDEKHMKKYKYFIEGYTRFHNQPIIIIGFESKGVYEHQRQEGEIYISLTSDAIVSIRYDSEIVIPGIARPVIFFAGYGITNPTLSGVVHYKPINNRWYLSDISVEGGTRISDTKLFKKDDRSTFHIEMALINSSFDITNVHQIPEKDRIDEDKPLEEQVEPDPEFWKTYKVSRPVNLVKEE